MKQDLFGDLPQSGLQLSADSFNGYQRQHLCQLEGVIESKAVQVHDLSPACAREPQVDEAAGEE
jgi:hypothetical protein